MNIRKSALELLNKYELGEQYINLSLYSLSLHTISLDERRLLTSLLYTTVEHKLTYDYYISAMSKREGGKIDPYTRNILRLGIAQIVDIASVPDFAAVNETVKLARNPGERSFVNGVLRAVSKNKESLPLPDPDKNFARFLSVKYSFPLQTVKLFVKLLGEEETEKLLVYYNTAKYTDLYVNTVKASVEEVMVSLKHQGLECKQNGNITGSLRINTPFSVEHLKAFRSGCVFVQDIASSLAVEALAPKKGERVIDVCSCPGGKSFASAIMMENEGQIYSFDLHESKLSLIESGKTRLGLDIISVAERDATKPDEALFESFDKVICDVPCSGLGVLSKKPDLRYKDLSEVGQLAELQAEILKQSAKYLKKGGVLLYSTCTLNPEENGDVVEAFLAQNKEFCKEEFTTGGLSSKNGMLTVIPHHNNSDGFFMAKIRRIG